MGPEQGDVEPSFSLRDRLLVAQKAWRLMARNAVGLFTDALTPPPEMDDNAHVRQIGERAELRQGAGELCMSRYMDEQEIGSETFRRRSTEELIPLPKR
jgi:hypothetical protein